MAGTISQNKEKGVQENLSAIFYLYAYKQQELARENVS
jgi:hypothetical protein